MIASYCLNAMLWYAD